MTAGKYPACAGYFLFPKLIFDGTKKCQKDKVKNIDFQKMVCYNQVRGESQIKF
jgi:hypothetical protein